MFIKAKMAVEWAERMDWWHHLEGRGGRKCSCLVADPLVSMSHTNLKYPKPPEHIVEVYSRDVNDNSTRETG